MGKIIKLLKDILHLHKGLSKKELKEFENTPRKWVFLPTLDGYILREFLIKLSILLLVFILGFIMGDVFDDMSDFVNSGASIHVTIQYFLFKLPGNIRFILPISMLLGCIWTLATMGKNQEVTAMRASGVSLMRCGGPIFFVGLIVTGINIYFNEQMVPYTDRAADVLMNQISGNKSFGKKMLVYRSNDGRRAWFFRVFEVDSKKQYVIFKHYRKNGTLEYDLNSKYATFHDGKGWEFTDVTKTNYTRDGLLPFASKKFKTIEMSSKDVPEKDDDILNAIKDEEDLSSWIIYNLLKRSDDMSQRMRNIYRTLFYYRLAFPWACFLAVFLGIPIATKGERSGIMFAIITAVAVIVAYIIVAQIFLILGKQGIVNPIIAGLAPTVAFILYGYYRVISCQS